MATKMEPSGSTAEDDGCFMSAALAEAEAAHLLGQCPVGAVLVKDGRILAKAGNRERELHDPTAYAEILVLREAGRVLKRHKFPDCDLYTTLAPCPMCENALLQAEAPRVVFGARSFRWIAETRFAAERLQRVGPTLETPTRATPAASRRPRTFQAADGTFCREYQQTITVGGRNENGFGTACRQPDGTWQLRS